MSKNTEKIKDYINNKESINQIFKDHDVDIYEMRRNERKAKEEKRNIFNVIDEITELSY